MTDIKMSDVFAMNTTLENSTGEGFLLKDNNCEYEEEYLAIIFDLNQARAITRAINNHDRLTEENDRLKADNAELVELVKLSCDRLDMLDSWIESQRSYAEWVNMDELEKRLAKSTSHLYKLIQKYKESDND